MPLTDKDRWPWLEQLAGVVQRHLAAGQPAVLACSALKPAYRRLLATGRRDGSSSIAYGRVAYVSSCGGLFRWCGTLCCSACFRICFAAFLLLAWLVLSLAGQSTVTAQPHPPSQVFLDPPSHMVQQRLERRAAEGGHFTPGAALLDSQLKALQYSEDELWMHVLGPPPYYEAFPPPSQIVDAVLMRLQLLQLPA